MRIAIVALAAAAASFAGAAIAADGGRPLSAHLMGSSETPAGDPDGMGHANVRVNVGQSEVCYDLMVEKIATASMAHIHKGAAGVAGPVAVPLTAPDASGKSSGCAKADAAVVKDILQNPANYYVNVHTADFPAGAIRGQLSK